MAIAKMRNFARENRLRGYTRHRRRDDLINFLRNNYQPAPQLQTWEPTRPTRPARPPPPPPPSVRFRLDRPRQPSSQEIDIFEQQEMSKSRPKVKNKLNEWYNWLVSNVPEPIKEKASGVFKTFKDKIMGLYKSFKGKETKEPAASAAEQNEESLALEQAFGRTYGSFRTKGRSWMDADTFFDG